MTNCFGPFGARLIEAEELGMDRSTDLLFLSFSALDWVGHDYGPTAAKCSTP